MPSLAINLEIPRSCAVRLDKYSQDRQTLQTNSAAWLDSCHGPLQFEDPCPTCK